MHPRVIEDIDELRSLTGSEVAVSPWETVTQDRIDAFAEATGDHQWIHVDAERARRESSFGGTIAHGYLTLALLPMLAERSFRISQPLAMTINYGANRIRFINPVRAGDRIRARFLLAELADVEAGWQATWNITVEMEGREKPAMAAVTITRYYRA